MYRLATPAVQPDGTPKPDTRRVIAAGKLPSRSSAPASGSSVTPTPETDR